MIVRGAFCSSQEVIFLRWLIDFKRLNGWYNTAQVILVGIELTYEFVMGISLFSGIVRIEYRKALFQI